VLRSTRPERHALRDGMRPGALENGRFAKTHFFVLPQGRSFGPKVYLLVAKVSPFATCMSLATGSFEPATLLGKA
jgi:hypothetical protein